MAEWPPKIGSKWCDDLLTREVLWCDGRKVQVRSKWRVRGGAMTSHCSTLPREYWERWAGKEVETFK